MNFIKLLKHLFAYFDYYRMFNGLLDGTYTFQSLNNSFLNVSIFDGNKEAFLTSKHSKSVNSKQELLAILDQLINFECCNIQNLEEKLNQFDIFCLKFSKKYQKFQIIAPVVIT